jgi:uncharacterized protein (DUF302 family)
MSGFTMAVTLDRPYDAILPLVRRALADQGFGVLTEIDVRATMKEKLDVDVPEQVILGACRPELAYRALAAAPSVAALLPCNVSVRQVGSLTEVETVDPRMLVELADGQDIGAVAAEAHDRLAAALQAVTEAVSEV